MAEKEDIMSNLKRHANEKRVIFQLEWPASELFVMRVLRCQYQIAILLIVEDLVFLSIEAPGRGRHNTFRRTDLVGARWRGLVPRGRRRTQFRWYGRRESARLEQLSAENAPTSET